jgi:hypothetical protein
MLYLLFQGKQIGYSQNICILIIGMLPNIKRYLDCMRQQLNEHKKSIPIKVECKINYETLTHTGTSITTMTLTC